MSEPVEPPTPTHTQITLEYGDGVWSDLTDHVYSGEVDRVAFLPFGTQQGNPTMELLVRDENGILVHATVPWTMWKSMTEVCSRWERRA